MSVSRQPNAVSDTLHGRRANAGGRAKWQRHREANTTSTGSRGFPDQTNEAQGWVPPIATSGSPERSQLILPTEFVARRTRAHRKTSLA